jgi:hypothetical protein
MDRRFLVAIVVMLALVGAFTVIGFVVDALRWLLVVAVVIAVAVALLSALRGGSSRSKT